MNNFNEIIAQSPILPFIREAGFAERQPWYFAERSLLDYLLIYVKEGRLKVIINGTEHILENEQFCLLQPGDIHSLEGITRTATPFLHFDIFYNPIREQSFPTRPGLIDLAAFSHLIQPRLNDIKGLHVPFHIIPVHPASFKETMLRTISLWLDGDVINQLEAEHLAKELILSILKGVSSFQQHKYQKDQSLKWIINYVSFHLSEPISLNDLAARAHLSTSRFAALFKEQFGTSPHQYLLHQRINHAQELLRSTIYSIQEVAAYCGFADIHHFSKAFKKRTGETPSKYRKMSPWLI